MPDIPAEIRQDAIELHRALGGGVFREQLARLDPEAAARLFPGDKQRLIRAFEVVQATGVTDRDLAAAGKLGSPLSLQDNPAGAAARARFTPHVMPGCVQMIEMPALWPRRRRSPRGVSTPVFRR